MYEVIICDSVREATAKFVAFMSQVSSSVTVYIHGNVIVVRAD
jgi:hypothetical protein